jgi:hypothetical protein
MLKFPSLWILLLGILFIISLSWIIPDIWKRYLIKKLAEISVGTYGENNRFYSFIRNSIINELSDICLIEVRKSKWNYGWFVKASIHGKAEYFPSPNLTDNEIRGEKHNPYTYLKTKEEAEQLKEEIMRKIMKHLEKVYKNSINANTIWED